MNPLTPLQIEVLEELHKQDTPFSVSIAHAAKRHWEQGEHYPRRVLSRGLRRKFEIANRETQLVEA